jgi:hypothetical protein
MHLKNVTFSSQSLDILFTKSVQHNTPLDRYMPVAIQPAEELLEWSKKLQSAKHSPRN